MSILVLICYFINKNKPTGLIALLLLHCVHSTYIDDVGVSCLGGSSNPTFEFFDDKLHHFIIIGLLCNVVRNCGERFVDNRKKHRQHAEKHDEHVQEEHKRSHLASC